MNLPFSDPVMTCPSSRVILRSCDAGVRATMQVQALVYGQKKILASRREFPLNFRVARLVTVVASNIDKHPRHTAQLYSRRMKSG